MPSAVDSRAERSAETSELRFLRRAHAIAAAQSPTSPRDTADVGEFEGRPGTRLAEEMAMFVGRLDAERSRFCTTHVFVDGPLCLVVGGGGERIVLATSTKNSDDPQTRNELNVRATARHFPQGVNGAADKDTLRLIDRMDPRQALALLWEDHRNR